MVKHFRVALAILLAMIVLSPVFFLLTEELILKDPQWEELLADKTILNSFANSLLISSLTGLFSVIISFPAAFVFAKCDFRGKDLLFFLYIVVMILPFQVTMLPHYLVSNALHIYDTPWALVLPGIFAPFSVFALTQTLKDFPDELIMAARMETSNYLKILFDVILPHSKSGLVAVFMLSFSEVWNSVAEPLVLLESSRNFPLSLLLDYSSAAQNVQILATVLYFAVPFILYLFFEKRIEWKICSQ